MSDDGRIPRHVWRISAVVIIGSIMSILDTTIVNVALDTLGRDLHAIDRRHPVGGDRLHALAGRGHPGHRLGGAALRRQACLPDLAGPVRRSGRRCAGLPPRATELIVFRVLQGIGGGMILPIGQLMMAEAAGPKRMGRVMSIVAVPAMLAPILGPTIGGLILDNTSWRWIFYVNVPIGVIAVIAAVRDPPHRRAPEDREPRLTSGWLLMATGLPLITYGLAEVGSTGSFTAPRCIVPADRSACCSSPPSSGTRCACPGRCSTCGCTGARPSRPPR